MEFELRKTLMTAVLLALVAGSAWAVGVNVKHAAADYGSWNTWAFLEEPVQTAAIEGTGHSEISAKVRKAIADRLRDMGYTQVEATQSPDFQVAIDGTMREFFNVESYHKKITDHIAFVLEGGISSYQEGTLLLRILDGDDHRVVWTGWVTEEIRNPDRPDRQIRRVVKRILSQFPPAEMR